MQVSHKSVYALTRAAASLGLTTDQGNPTTPDDMAALFRAMLGEITYENLHSVNIDMVSRRIARFHWDGPDIAVGRLVAIARAWSPVMLACNSCGRVGLRFEGERAVPLERGQRCPAPPFGCDAGLVDVDVDADGVVLNWRTGKLVVREDGGTFDREGGRRLPLDPEALAQLADGVVRQALHAENVSPSAFLHALVLTGSDDIKALTILQKSPAETIGRYDVSGVRGYVREIITKSRSPQVHVSHGTAGKHDLFDTLCRLLPAQFEEVVFRLGIGSHLISPATAPQSIRAMEVLRVCHSRTPDLLAAITRVSGL